MEPIKWISKTVNINELIPAEYNPRKLTQKQEAELNASIDKFDICDPIIINKNNIIIGGHQRIKVLKKRNVTLVDVRIPSRDLTIEEEKELNLRLNKNMGEWDFKLLSNFDKDLLINIGFDSIDIDKIFPVVSDEKDDAIPEVKENEYGVVTGDIWELGNHRLMCGDSTLSDVAILMDGKLADMIHTDPPYNVNYGANKKHPSHKIRSIENDHQSKEDWEDFCNKLFLNFKAFNKGDIYMWGASGPEGMKMRLLLCDLGCHWSATIIWKKDRLVLTPANYQRMYEPCFYGWFGKSTYQGDRKNTEVWEEKRPSSSKLHPTMKPVELCSRAIINSSKQRDIVLDLFLGSGSTLIACEKTGRYCYGMELNQHYCSVIIKRWEDFTGLKAKKI